MVWGFQNAAGKRIGNPGSRRTGSWLPCVPLSHGWQPWSSVPQQGPVPAPFTKHPRHRAPGGHPGFGGLRGAPPAASPPSAAALPAPGSAEAELGLRAFFGLFLIWVVLFFIFLTTWKTCSEGKKNGNGEELKAQLLGLTLHEIFPRVINRAERGVGACVQLSPCPAWEAPPRDSFPTQGQLRAWPGAPASVRLRAGCAAPGVPEPCGGAPAAPIPHKDTGPGWAAGRLLSECKPGSIHLLTLFRNHFP